MEWPLHGNKSERDPAIHWLHQVFCILKVRDHITYFKVQVLEVQMPLVPLPLATFISHNRLLVLQQTLAWRRPCCAVVRNPKSGRPALSLLLHITTHAAMSMFLYFSWPSFPYLQHAIVIGLMSQLVRRTAWSHWVSTCHVSVWC